MPDQFDPYHVWLGIPPQEQPPNHYRLLGLGAFEENSDVISNALDQRIRHLRSVQAGKRAALSQQLLNEVSAVGVCLLDPARKKAYDEQLRKKLATSQPAPAPASSPVVPIAQPIPMVPPMPVLPMPAVPTPPLPNYPPPVPAPPMPNYPAPVVSVPPMPPSVAAADPLVAVARFGGSRKRPARDSSGLLLTVLGLCGLGVLTLVAAGTWYGTRRADELATTASASAGNNGTPSVPTTNPPPAKSGDPTSPVTNPAVVNRANRAVWIPTATKSIAFRLVNGQWIEFQEKQEVWYSLAATTPAYIELADQARGIGLRLYDERMERRTSTQEWAVVMRGSWKTDADLPAFARRAPAATAPLVNRTGPQAPPAGTIVAAPSTVGRPAFEDLAQQASAQPPVAGSGARRPVPQGDALAAAQEKARGIYERDFKQASKSPQKATLAQRILGDAEASAADPIARYVLIDLARKVFVQAGEVLRSLEAAEKLEAEYDLPRGELLTATVFALDDIQLLPEHRQELAKTAIGQAEEAWDASDYAQADKLSALAAQSATRQKDTDLRKDVTLRRNAIVRAVKDWNTAQAKLASLKTNPDDPVAHLYVGRYFCLVAEDFARGLPYLAKSGDAIWEPPAKLDLASAGGAATARKAAAEAWETAAAKVTDQGEKLAVQRREKWLWEQASSGLSGLDQVRAKRRLEDLRDVAAKSPRTKTEAGPPAAAPGVGMVGRVINAAGKDAGLLVTYELDHLIDSSQFDDVRGRAGSSPPVQIVLEGLLILEEDTLVQFYPAATTSGWNQVFVNNVAVKSVGEGQITTTSSVNTSLRRGTHAIRWVLNGAPDFGIARLRVSRAAAPGAVGGDLPLTIDARLQAAAERIPTTTTIHFGRPPR